MDCENGTSLSQTIEKLEETPKDMKAFTFKNTGEEGDINHVGEEAVIFKDSDVGEPDEGNSNEGDGGAHIDNIADEIGEPAKELVDVVAGEPTVAEKDDEFGAFVGEPVEEESSNSMEEVKEKISAEPLKVIEIGKENSIESLKVTDNENRSLNGEEILKANDRPVEDTSNSMQEFERETSTEPLKVTYNEEKILKVCGQPVEEDNDQSMQEVEEDISTESLKVTYNEDFSANEEKILKGCGEPVEEDNDQSMQEVEEDISTECLKVIDNEEKILKGRDEPVEEDNDQSMQGVEEDISTEGLKVNEDRSVNEEEFPKACGEPVEDDNDQSMQEVEEDISTEGLKVIDNEDRSVNEEFPKACGEPVEEDNDQSMQEVEEDTSTEGLKVTDYKCCLVNKEEFPKACGEPEENNDQSMQEVEEDISTECLKVIDNEEKSLQGRGEPVEEDNDQSMQEVEEDISTKGLKVNEDGSVNEEEFPKACAEPVEDDNDQSTQEVEEHISNEGLNVIDNKDGSVNEEFPKSCGEPVKEESSNSMQEVKEEVSAEPLTVMANEECSVNDEEVPKANEDNIQCALADNDTVSKINTKSEVPKTCISDTKSLSNVKSSRALKKRKRKTQFKSSSYEEKSKVGDVKSPEGGVLNTHGDDYDHGSDGGGIEEKGAKEENIKPLEGYLPNNYGNDNDGSSDGGGAKCLRSSSFLDWSFPFGSLSKIELLLLVTLWVLAKSATGAMIQPYHCCTFDSEDPKMSLEESKFSIKSGEQEICIHNPPANCSACPGEGAVCLISNKQVVKFCVRGKILEGLILDLGKNKSTIRSSNPEELSVETVQFLLSLCNSKTTTANPVPTTLHSSPVELKPMHHFGIIGTAGVAALLCLCVCFCYCRSLRRWVRDHCQCEFISTRPSTARLGGDRTSENQGDVTAEEGNELNAMKEKDTVIELP